MSAVWELAAAPPVVTASLEDHGAEPGTAEVLLDSVAS